MDVSNVEVIENSICRLKTNFTLRECAGEEGSEFIVKGLELSLTIEESSRLIIRYRSVCHCWTIHVPFNPNTIWCSRRHPIHEDILVSIKRIKLCTSIRQ